MSALDAEVRRADPARWLAARFAPGPARARLVALYAFNHEIARVRESVSDPLMGEIRLTWWREAVEEIYAAARGGARPVRRHPVVEALAAALADPTFRPEPGSFEALIAARTRALDAPEGFADLAAVEDHVEETAGGLVRLAARLLVPEPLPPALDAALVRAGRAWGLAGLARAFPLHAAAGWIAAPGAPSRAALARLIAERDAAAVRALTAPLAASATQALGEARAGLAAAPAALWPAYGYAALVASQLAALARPDADPFALALARPGLADRLRLVRAAARGTV